jgi:putative sigma-54 modulation protein
LTEFAVQWSKDQVQVVGPLLKEVFVLLVVSSRHLDVTEPLKNYAEQKASKLTRYFDRIQEIEVVFDTDKQKVRLEMIVHAEHRSMFVASYSHEDAYACVDGCTDKLERQLSEHKKKYRNRKHPASTDKRQIRRTGS